MTGSERRALILKKLRSASGPLSGTLLGEELDASRQIIVQDIALLRAQGYDISSTNRGYVLKVGSQASRLFKVRHGQDEIEQEMNAIVDLGGCIEDVWVNHRTYGRIEASLGVRNRRDVKRFLADLDAGISSPLSDLTDGYHFHTITAESEEVLDEIAAELAEMGFVAEFTQYELETFL